MPVSVGRTYRQRLTRQRDPSNSNPTHILSKLHMRTGEKKRKAIVLNATATENDLIFARSPHAAQVTVDEFAWLCQFFTGWCMACSHERMNKVPPSAPHPRHGLCGAPDELEGRPQALYRDESLDAV